MENKTEKVRLSQEKETLLATLHARAMDSRSPRPILGDPLAVEVAGRIDYDFSRLKVTSAQIGGLAIRAQYLDVWTSRFVIAHPNAVVLHLGCGLDGRVFRVDPPAGVDWFDLDFPEVVELHERLYPQRPGYLRIGSSVTDTDWLSKIPHDRPTMVVAEGLTQYLTETDVRRLLDDLTAHLASGEIAFDAYNRLNIRLGQRAGAIQATGAQLRWGVDNPHELQTWVPALVLIEEFFLVRAPEAAQLPRSYRALTWVMNRAPALRRMNRLLRYGF